MIQARNFAVMTGVQAGLTCAMKRARGGVEDIQTRCSFLKLEITNFIPSVSKICVCWAFLLQCWNLCKPFSIAKGFSSTLCVGLLSTEFGLYPM